MFCWCSRLTREAQLRFPSCVIPRWKGSGSHSETAQQLKHAWNKYGKREAGSKSTSTSLQRKMSARSFEWISLVNMVVKWPFNVFTSWHTLFFQESKIGQREATVCSEIPTVFRKKKESRIKPSQLQPDGRRCSVYAVCVRLPFPFTCTNPYKPSSPPPPQKTHPHHGSACSVPPLLSPTSSCQRDANRALLSHHLPLCAWSTWD